MLDSGIQLDVFGGLAIQAIGDLLTCILVASQGLQNTLLGDLA